MKITTAKIKELISEWLIGNEKFISTFDGWFGDRTPSKNELNEYSKLKCEADKDIILQNLIKYVSDGKNWTRYEKAKFDLEEYNEENNGQEEIIGWKSDNFKQNYDKYIVRRFKSKLVDIFDDRILRVLSNEDDTEIVSWSIFEP